MIKFVIQAYGRNDIIEQSLVSAVSLLKWLPKDAPHQIEIFTDQAARLERFFSGIDNVRPVAFSQEQMRQWRGPLDFVHRAKIEILKKASTDSRLTGLIYLDGDTLLIKDPAPMIRSVESGELLMHLEESRLAKPQDPLTRKIARFVRGKVWNLNGKKVEIPPSTAMWNAGVIGVSARHFDVWDEILELTDQLYGGYQKHVMEQLAVSFCLQQRGTVQPTDDVVLHYWPQKEVFQTSVHEFLEKYPEASSGLGNFESWPWPSLVNPMPSRKRRGLSRWLSWISS